MPERSHAGFPRRSATTGPSTRPPSLKPPGPQGRPMNHTKAILSSLSLVLALGAAGCSRIGRSSSHASTTDVRAQGSLADSPILDFTTPAELPTLSNHLQMRFAQLKPKMTINEFKALFSEACFVKRERVSWSDHPIDAHELSFRQRPRFAKDPQIYLQVQKARSYFVASSLEGRGEPQAWPSPPPHK